MPPFVPRKRQFSPELASPTPPRSNRKAAKSASRTTGEKAGLFQAADAPDSRVASAADTKRLLQSLDDGGDDNSSLSEVDSDDFEDVPPAKRQKTTKHSKPIADNRDEDEEEDEDMNWEDAFDPDQNTAQTAAAEPEIGDISISLTEDGTYVEPLISLATGKKGPSKRERQVRTQTHCLHVLSLMWHNTVRNSWLNDKQVQKILVDGLPDGVKREVRRWREAMGTLSKEELEAKKRQMAAAKGKGRRGGRKSQSATAGRDWSFDADHLEQGVPNLSRGDPLLRLLKVLSAYWRKRFLITAPGLRKQGYMPLKRLRDDIRAWDKDRHNQDAFGERIENRGALRKLAAAAEGSKDVGAQLFCALLRGLGLEARMVANLQPAGLGFNSREEAPAKSSKTSTKKEERKGGEETDAQPAIPSSPASSKKKPKKTLLAENPTRKSERGNQARPINLDGSDSELSDPPSDMTIDDCNAEPVATAKNDSEDDLSVIDVTPSMPRRRITKKYDRDMGFPNYWTEVCSPATHKFIPVDPIVLSTIASNEELLQTFEPRGMRADKAKQVICYTLAYSSDGSAKDVTVRYLKKHQLPGKTKGVRMPVEKIPVHNSRGKVKKYEDFDWFRTAMCLYDRPHEKRTTADDLEEQTDLKPFKPVKEVKEVEKESLQWYKQSAEFVLEQHLRREEALLPGSKPVRTFTAGKGDKAVDHLVYRRKDVVACKTVESWHKEGRSVNIGEQPMKMVPVRAVTLMRKREMEDAQRETGEKLKQGLYSRDQTDWIIPPPIENGVIPKNAFGNMDVYVPTMVPEGAVHLPLKGTAKLCRRLDIDYAEACTGFEFGKQRAVPVITGVVVAKEHEKMVRDAWRVEQEEIKRKEDTKRTATSLHWWRKMLMGLRIVERMKAEYEHVNGGEDEVNPFVSKAKREGRQLAIEDAQDDDDNAGGFFRPGREEEETAQHRKTKEEDELGGGFLTESEDDAPAAGGFIVEHGSDNERPASSGERPQAAAKAPISLQSMHDKPETRSDLVNLQRGSPSVRSRGTKSARSKARGKTPGQKSRKARARSSSTSSLSEVDSALNSISDSDVPAGHGMRSGSPQVIVRLSQTKPRAQRRARDPRSGKRATEQKSKYFANEDEDDLSGTVESSASEEEEVIRPRRTTTRTRSAPRS